MKEGGSEGRREGGDVGKAQALMFCVWAAPAPSLSTEKPFAGGHSRERGGRRGKRNTLARNRLTSTPLWTLDLVSGPGAVNYILYFISSPLLYLLYIRLN